MAYQGERLEENVRELSETLHIARWSRFERSAGIADVAAAIDKEFGGLGLFWRALQPQAELKNPLVETSREGFRVAPPALFSLVAADRAVLPLMERRGGGSVLALTYLGSRRVLDYNVMGVAKAALEASVIWQLIFSPNIRVNAISAGPIKHWPRPDFRAFCRSTANGLRSDATLRPPTPLSSS